MKVSTYNLTARNGRHIRKATQVEFPDGRVVRFMERMAKRDAIAAAQVIGAAHLVLPGDEEAL